MPKYQILVGGTLTADSVEGAIQRFGHEVAEVARGVGMKGQPPSLPYETPIKGAAGAPGGPSGSDLTGDLKIQQLGK